jgi:hypothetical protein
MRADKQDTRRPPRHSPPRQLLDVALLLILLAIAILALAGARRAVLDQSPQAAGPERAALFGSALTATT